MLYLTRDGLKDRVAYENAGISLPEYNVTEVAAHTAEHPVWVHFGAGNIFRGFIAVLQQSLLNQGLEKSGIIAAETFDFDIVDKIYRPFDNLALLVGLKPDGGMVNSVIGSITDAYCACKERPEELSKLTAVFENPELQMVSFTITEKGYALEDINGNFLPVVTADMEQGPENASHAMSVVTAFMWKRFQAGAYKIALVSMDNCSHNGEKLRSSVLTIAKEWQKRGFVSAEFVDYISDEEQVAFPWSMIDKITPRPAESVEKALKGLGVADMAPVVTSRNTYIAPFVNAEIPQYLVVEDRFPNGRPRLEKAGVYMTDRDTVNNTERMKVTTCLNPLHTALAVYGCMLGYTKIADEMKDKELKLLIEKIGYDEGMPVVVDPKILSPRAFIKEVIEERLPNPFIPDMPQRIATDTGLKVPIRFGETMKSYLASDTLNITDLVYIPLAIAGWLRYLMGRYDNGTEMEISPDPTAAGVQETLKTVEFGNPASYTGQLRSVLSNKSLFAVDLCEVGLAPRIEAMFCEMIAGEGAVRETLKKYLYA
ncbi:MAG: mannitol dehydrogenase family protein [Lachnospiraceae bacterium]|nr:mannitol dehydrogenase family protein [Lachnospiraceae bacterium]